LGKRASTDITKIEKTNAEIIQIIEQLPALAKEDIMKAVRLAGQAEESQHSQALPGKCYAQSSFYYRADQCIDYLFPL
jgi:hypothetical protein